MKSGLSSNHYRLIPHRPAYDPRPPSQLIRSDNVLPQAVISRAPTSTYAYAACRFAIATETLASTLLIVIGMAPGSGGAIER